MSDDESAVSRETSPEARVPPVPSVARGVFPADRLEQVVRYVELLATEGTLRGLIGPREVPRLWERHVLNCAVLAEAVPAGADVADVGSGAGLPGLVLALARPDVTVTLVEPLLRRTTFLLEVVGELGLEQVTVVRGRAEALHGGPGFDVVTSRAVSALTTLLDWSMPLVRPSGALVALKGASAATEIAEAEETLRAWGCATPEVLTLGRGVLSEPACAVRIAWADPAGLSWPPTRQGAVGRRSTNPMTSRAPRSHQQRRHRDR